MGNEYTVSMIEHYAYRSLLPDFEYFKQKIPVTRDFDYDLKCFKERLNVFLSSVLSTI